MGLRFSLQMENGTFCQSDSTSAAAAIQADQQQLEWNFTHSRTDGCKGWDQLASPLIPICRS